MLQALQAVAITLEEHAVTKEWTLTANPKADTPLPIQLDISSNASMDDAIRRAQEEGLRNLTPEQQAELPKLKRQLQLIHFFDGLTTFSGVAVFLVGAAFIYRFAVPWLSRIRHRGGFHL